MDLRGELADRFVAFQSLAVDIVFTREAVYVAASWAEREPWMVIPNACWNAAVVAYGRCFLGGGRRHRFKAEIVIPESRRALHKWLLDIRRKHVGHLDRKDRAEIGRALLILERPPGQRVKRTMVAGGSWAMPSRVGLAQVAEHLTWVASEIEQHRLAAAEAILERVNAMPVSEIYRHAESASTLVLPGDDG